MTQVQRNVLEEERGASQYSLQEVSTDFVSVPLPISGYDVGFSLCIYLIPLLSLAYVFRLICHHAYDPVMSATTSEVV